ncbi:hypothetical protein BDQ17DRAFT_1536652 [Cyathus striatus]|nr:hypothetical protein BDQ17DRAFT_1536652 [Cyathus striatus]
MRGRTGVVIFLFCFLPASFAGSVNYTIDDSYGDSRTRQLPTFLPATAGVWADQTCEGCRIKPDVMQAFMGTYTAATYHPALMSTSISMSFEGIAIYVYFTLPNNQGDGITTITMVNFTIDGDIVGSFTHNPDMSTFDILYQQMVFNMINLPNGTHQLVISTSGVDISTFTNFDYAEYTHVEDDIAVTSTSSESPSSSIGNTQASSSSVQTSETSSSSSQSSTSSTQSSSSNTRPSTSSAQLPSSTTQLTAGKTLSLVYSSTQTSPHITQSTSSNSSPTTSGSTTSETGVSSNSKVKLVGAIAGGAGGGVILIGAIIAVFLCWRRRTRNHEVQIPSYRALAAGVNSTSTPSLIIAPIVDDYNVPSESDSPATPGFYSENPHDLHSSRGLLSSESNYSTPTQEEINESCQSELDQRFLMEMNALSTGPASHPMPSGSSNTVGGSVGAGEALADDDKINQMREQMQAMQARIGLLQFHQRTSWARGPPDDSPPDYTP